MPLPAAAAAEKRAPISLGGGVSKLEARTMRDTEALRSQFAAQEITYDHAPSEGGAAGASAKERARAEQKQRYLAAEAAAQAAELAAELEAAANARGAAASLRRRDRLAARDDRARAVHAAEPRRGRGPPRERVADARAGAQVRGSSDGTARASRRC